MNSITILGNREEIRKAFVRKFAIPLQEWPEVCRKRKWMIDYEVCFLWDRLSGGQEIIFAKALDCLKSLSEDVFFMSESELMPYCEGIRINGIEYKGGVAKMNAAALADLIAYEWYENFRLGAQDMYLEYTVLPADLYVFDASMEHMLVFTHENDYWGIESEQPMLAADSRFCLMIGFEVPEITSYEKLRLLLAGELWGHSSLVLELSYSCPKQYRVFTVSKQTTESGTGYVYWFEFAPDTRYDTLEETEEAKVFDGLSLRELSKLTSSCFAIRKINGIGYGM